MSDVGSWVCIDNTTNIILHFFAWDGTSDISGLEAQGRIEQYDRSIHPDFPIPVGPDWRDRMQGKEFDKTTLKFKTDPAAELLDLLVQKNSKAWEKFLSDRASGAISPADAEAILAKYETRITAKYAPSGPNVVSDVVSNGDTP